MAELRCEGLTKSYGARAVLAGVDLAVAPATLTAILGASGSGKTTLLRIVMGLLGADRGSVTIGGRLVADADGVDVPPDKRSVGYVAQEAALFPHLNVGENVGFGLSRRERRNGTRVEEMLDLVGLDASYRDRRPHELSGGEQRRVALARALAPQPRLVLLDEPFSGLDAALRVDTREAVLRALARARATAVLVTHDQAEALSMGDEVAVLRRGQIVQCAEPTTLYREPADLELACFVGEAVVLAGEAQAGTVECALGRLAERASERAQGRERGGTSEHRRGVRIVIRPEQIQIHPSETPDAVPGRVLERTCYGPDTLVRISLEHEPETQVKARTLAHDPPAPGERVWLSVRGPVVSFPAGAARTALVAVLAALALAVAGCGSHDPNSLVLYNGQHPQLTRALVSAFERQSHIDVRVRSNDSIVLADQIMQEGDRSLADAYLAENSPELTALESHGLLSRLEPDVLGHAPSRYNSPRGRWAGVALRVSALAYDSARAPAQTLPASVLQLAEPAWHGKLALAPTDSDFLPLVAAVIAKHGEAATESWLAGLKRNARLYDDDEAVVAAVNRGDEASGLINSYYWFRMRRELGAGAIHSAIHYFPGRDVGSVENISGAGVLASSRHRRAAEAFVRFLVSPAAQRILASSDDYEYPVRADVEPNAALPALSQIAPAEISPGALGDGERAARLIRRSGLL